MSESMQVVALREGDVFRFHYSTLVIERWRTDPRWCFDGQVVVRNGKLCDTYWGFDASEPRIVTPDEGELTFVCNLHDVTDIREYETRHYAEADVFNLSHQHGCYKRFVVRTGAVKNADRILDEIRLKEHSVRGAMDCAVRDLVQLGQLRMRVESGDLSRLPWW